jgi:hypothetical protein
MVVGLGLDSDRVKACRAGFVVAQARPGGGLVEDLHYLSAETARELAAATRWSVRTSGCGSFAYQRAGLVLGVSAMP